MNAPTLSARVATNSIALHNFKLSTPGDTHWCTMAFAPSRQTFVLFLDQGHTRLSLSSFISATLVRVFQERTRLRLALQLLSGTMRGWRSSRVADPDAIHSGELARCDAWRDTARKGACGVHRSGL